MLNGLKKLVAMFRGESKKQPYRKATQSTVRLGRDIGLEGREVPSAVSSMWPGQATNNFSMGSVAAVAGHEQNLLVAVQDNGIVTVAHAETGHVIQTIVPMDGFKDLRVAAGTAGKVGSDVNGDGFGDFVVTAGYGGGPRVQVWEFNPATGQFVKTRDFFMIEQDFRGGYRVGLGDVDGDGYADILGMAGEGGGPRLTIISYRDNRLIANLFAYSPDLRDGGQVSTINLDGDQYMDVVVSPGKGGGPHVRVMRGADMARNNAVDLASFWGSPNINSRDGLAMTAGNLSENGEPIIITTPVNAKDGEVRVFSGGGQQLAWGGLRELMPNGASATLMPAQTRGEQPSIYVGGIKPLLGTSVDRYVLEPGYNWDLYESPNVSTRATTPLGTVVNLPLANTDIKPAGPEVTTLYSQIFVTHDVPFNFRVTADGNTSGISAWVKITEGDGGPVAAQWDFPVWPGVADLSTTLWPGKDYRLTVTTLVTGPVAEGQTFQFKLEAANFGPNANSNTNLPFAGPWVNVLTNVVPNVPPVNGVPVVPPPATVPPAPPAPPPVAVPNTSRVTFTGANATAEIDLWEGDAPLGIFVDDVAVQDNPAPWKETRLNVTPSSGTFDDDVTLWGIITDAANNVIDQKDVRVPASGGVVAFDWADPLLAVGNYRLTVKAEAGRGADDNLNFRVNVEGNTFDADDALYYVGERNSPTVDVNTYARVTVLGAASLPPVTITSADFTTIDVQSITVSKDVTITGVAFTLLQQTPGLSIAEYLELGPISVSIGNGAIAGNTLAVPMSNQIFAGVANTVDLALKAKATAGATDGGRIQTQLVGFTFVDSASGRQIPTWAITQNAGLGAVGTVDV